MKRRRGDRKVAKRFVARGSPHKEASCPAGESPSRKRASGGTGATVGARTGAVVNDARRDGEG